MPGPETIGEVEIKVGANTSGLKASISDAKKEVEEVGDAAEKTSGKVSGAFTRAGEAIETSTSGVRKFVGALSSVAGVATGLVGVFGLVSGAVLGFKSILESLGGDGDRDKPLPKAADLLDDLADKARGLDKALSSSPGFVALLDEIEALETRIASLNRIASGAGSAGVGAGGQNILDIQDQISKAEDELQIKIKQRGDLLENVARAEEEAEREAERARAEEESIKKRAASLESLEKIAEGLSISLLEEDEQIIANAELQIKELKRIAKEGGIDSDDFILRAAITAVEEIREKNLETVREQERIKDDAQRARDAESAAKQIESAQRAAEAFARGLDGIFGADFTTRLDNLTAAVRDGNNAIRRLK